jgi:hypothetical protein
MAPYCPSRRPPPGATANLAATDPAARRGPGGGPRYRLCGAAAQHAGTNAHPCASMRAPLLQGYFQVRRLALGAASTTLQAYRLLRAAGAPAAELQRVRAFLLQQRHNGH